VGSTKKDATCEVVISYIGSSVNEADSSVSCSISWPKVKALNYAKSLSYTLGDTSDFFSAEISFKLTKTKNKNNLKTVFVSAAGLPLSADAEFYPATLWCPQEDYMIWGQGAYGSVVNEANADGYEECARRCAEYTNEAGNAPCFSWTINNSAEAALDLAPGKCRLLAYMNVTGVAMPGVQSGYHKCWNAMQTVEP